MKTLSIIFCLAILGSLAHADLFDDRERQIEAQERAQGRVAAAAELAAGQARLHTLFEHMAKNNGGLVNWSPGIIHSGGLLLMSPYQEMSFETGSHVVCHPIMYNTNCNDANCSNLKLMVVNCINASNQKLKMDASGRLYPWPSH